ncbi:polysaccharide biosynthesis tyrosine autokinase [Vibrio agarivorans]|uniref:Polysaccharide biosynthesis tyrosine autokinase n=1 Tax=Vibrio agarivorans TaxID=153622 RepID=A0ABT7Y0D1_9VIBR|nr:polysaccharide biosynthesis tyrosine autokinase [Vibrio agarivorans]MDN2481483.1 polysaccharide biosynthesis tyrosine autokinase [Vibrio agarivorans]
MAESINRTQTEDEIDLGRLFSHLLDHWWFILILTVSFTAIGGIYAWVLTPIYKADSLIHVEQRSSGVSSLVSDGFGDMFHFDSSATTEVEILKSRMVLGKTVDKLGLDISVEPQYSFFGGQVTARALGINAFADVGYIERLSHRSEEFLLVKIDNVKFDYALYDVQGEHLLNGRVGEMSTANDEVAIFVVDLVAENGQEFIVSRSSRVDAVSRLQNGLSISERGNQSGILQLSLEGRNQAQIERILDDISVNYVNQNVSRQQAEAEKSLLFLHQHLPKVESALNQAEDLLNEYRQDQESVDLSLEARSTLQVMVQLEAQLNELSFKETEVSQRYTPDHPAYVSLLQQRQTLLAEKERLNKQIQRLPRTQREVLRLTRDVEVNQQIYVQLLNKVQELNILKAGTVGNVRIIDDAQSYPHPVKPKKALIVVLATLLGGMLSVAAVLVKLAFYRGMLSPDEIEELGIAVYACVPKSKQQQDLTQKGKNNYVKAVLAHVNPADISVEALRSLRTSLHFAMLEAKNNIVVISGPCPNIGKSFVATNFASVAAQSGQRVLLIDGDMRKGQIHKTMGLEQENGLSDYLIGSASAEQIIDSTQSFNGDVITRGTTPPNPSELLMSTRFSELLEWANQRYDLVIVDTPPILAVTDPSVVGAMAGTTMLVARYGVNTAKELEVSKARFEQAGVDVKGVIFNAVEDKRSNGYGYYSYGYAYTDRN